MPENFVAEIKQDARKQMVDLLNANLSNAIALTLAVKQAHWNLKGMGFIGVHKLLDEVAERTREAADLLAERAVMMGGIAEGTLETVAKTAQMQPYPKDISDIAKHIEALKQRFIFVGGELRKAIDVADKAGDADTADILTQISRAVDKDAWFIGANA